jgi:uncharacterized protein (TIGR04255 family)
VIDDPTGTHRMPTTSRLPDKLTSDAILEAVLEVRFETNTHMVPEVIFGRFADNPEWSEYRQARLPTADIPAALKQLEPNLKYQPSLEFTSPDGIVCLRIGSNVMSASRRGEYIGWSVFEPILHTALNQLFKSVRSISVGRLGLRYINALNPQDHFVSSISELGLSVAVDEKPLLDHLNLNFKKHVSDEMEITARIASPAFAQGNIPPRSVAIIDIDVYTPEGVVKATEQEVKNWISLAHAAEKEAFFEILGPELTDKLRAS